MGCGVVDAVGETGSENFGAGGNDPGSLIPCFYVGPYIRSRKETKTSEAAETSGRHSV